MSCIYKYSKLIKRGGAIFRDKFLPKNHHDIAVNERKYKMQYEVPN